MRWAEFTKGLIRRNPLFVLLVGICPALATSNTIQNAVSMGIAATTVLVCSNFIISLIRKSIPKGVRIPCFIVVISSFVTICELVMKAVLPLAVSEALGIFIPLIVVNCIILYRAEDFASKHGTLSAVLDGLGMGIGFTGALVVIACIRETFGSATVWDLKWWEGFPPVLGLAMAPGAFLVLGFLLAFFNWLGQRRRAEAGS